MSALTIAPPDLVARPHPHRRVSEAIGPGPAVVVATRDAALRPQIARGWAVELLEGGLARLCIEAGDGSRARGNLEGHREIAVTLARPSTYRSVQLKGTVLKVREPTDEQRRAAEEHQLALSDEVAAVGVLPRLAMRLLDSRALVSVTLTLDELYDQTPGPAAGAEL